MYYRLKIRFVKSDWGIEEMFLVGRDNYSVTDYCKERKVRMVGVAIGWMFNWYGIFETDSSKG